jgi:uncharacterized membrane protein
MPRRSLRALLLFAALGLAGCTFAVTGTHPNGRGDVVPYTTSLALATPVATAPGIDHHDAIDLTAVLHNAISIPDRIESLQRTLVICSIVLAVFGLANAALLMVLLGTRVRARSVVPAPVPAAGTFCACGATISARTKTGRCRSCARDQRAKARPIATRALPVASAAQAKRKDSRPAARAAGTRADDGEHFSGGAAHGLAR